MLAAERRGLELVPCRMPVELEIQVRRGILHSVKVPIEVDDAFGRVEAHRFNQVKVLAFAAHEIPFQQTLVPFIAWLAVDDKS